MYVPYTNRRPHNVITERAQQYLSSVYLSIYPCIIVSDFITGNTLLCCVLTTKIEIKIILS